jgi:hypothetical protein
MKRRSKAKAKGTYEQHTCACVGCGNVGSKYWVKHHVCKQEN